MTIILSGVAECIAGIAKITARQHEATRTGLEKCAHLLEREIKANLSIGSHALGEPTTSSPGSPPDLVSGDLRRSIQVEGPHSVGAHWEAEVGPTAVYGRIQELGGVAGRGAVLPARPYVAPALETMQPVMLVVMRESWAAGQVL